MAHVSSLLIQFILIFPLGIADTGSGQPKLTMCPAEVYDVPNGKFVLKSRVSYILKCLPGHAVPWGFPNQNFSYTCQKNGHIDVKVPRGCIKFRHARRKIAYSVLFNMSLNTPDPCANQSILRQIESQYNNTVMPLPEDGSTVSGQRRVQMHSGYFTNCYRMGDFAKAEFTLTDMAMATATQSQIDVRDSKIIFLSYSVISSMFRKLGFYSKSSHNSTQQVSLEGLSYEDAVKEYYCEKNLGYRVDAGMHVCVGCGRGWWMHDRNKSCHPCGPGFYNDEENAGECRVCDVQFAKAPWAAISLDDCFPREVNVGADSNSIHIGIIIPFLYMIFLTILVVIGSKIMVTRLQSNGDVSPM